MSLTSPPIPQRRIRLKALYGIAFGRGLDASGAAPLNAAVGRTDARYAPIWHDYVAIATCDQ
jgi:hypothetical protein